MENVYLKQAEIYVNKKKGISCSYHNETSKWLLGNFVINQFKVEDPNVINKKLL
jgi:hypothetical protein